MKLAAKLILISVVAVVAVMAASNFYAAHFTLARIKKNHQQYADKMADELEPSIVDAWKSGGINALEKHLSRPDIQPVARWVWFEEETVTETRRPYANADFSEVITRKQTASYVVKMGDGTQHLYTYCPVDLGDAKKGGLEFTKTLEEHERETWEDFVEFLIAISSMALVSILTVWIAGVRMIGRPLNTLIDATKRIANGDFTGRINLPGNDELSQLGRSINNMSQHLEEQNKTIENETNDRINAMKQLRHADRLKTVGRMAASIAHDVGTPLSVVSGRAALIAKGDLTPAQVKQNAETIQNESDRISAMIRRALDFARQTPPQKSSTDLNEILIQSSELLTPLAERQQVEIRTSLADDRAMAVVDPGQIQQVLTNMIMNGIQSMPTGGRLELGLRLQQVVLNGHKPTDYWLIGIKDQGEGIPAENLESIFEPFFTTKDVGQGTGLGLSIAYTIMQEQDGWIEVESEVKQGSHFKIFLPALPG
jgi:two-component system NtrC family sensor kinase